jgi:hypothetical protein
MMKLAALGLLLVLAACPHSEEDYKKQKAPEDNPVVSDKPAPPPPPPPKKALTPEELGKCDLKVTGALTAEQTTFGGRSATNVTYWMSEDEKKNLMGVDGFAINCMADKIKLSLTPIGKPDLQPFAPKKYVFKGGHSDGAAISVLFPPQTTLGDPNGTVDITAFDKSHIAGTIELSGKLMGKGAKGSATVSGSFDFKCPGFSGCEM